MSIITNSRLMKFTVGVTTCLLLTNCGRDSGKNKSAQKQEQIVDTNLIDQNVTSDTAILKFGSNITNASYQCRVDVVESTNQNQASNPQWTSCSASGLTVSLPADSLVTVSIKAVAPSGAEDTSPLTLRFKGKQGQQEQQKPAPTPEQNTEPAPVKPTLPNPAPENIPPVGQEPGPETWSAFTLDRLILGSSWQFNVPQNMHVLQYSAAGSLGGSIDVLQLMQGQDQNYFSMYPGNFHQGNGCSRFASQPVGIRSPAGKVLGYCAGKVRGTQQVKRLFGYDYAANHIEVGSNEGAPVQSRILVQLYDHFQRGDGILNAICRGQTNRSGINEIFAAMPVMNGFWAYSYLLDNVKTCRVTLNGLNGGRWQVAGFVFTQSEYANNHCGNGNGNNRCQRPNQKAMEVLYMEKNEGGMTRYSDYFARDFQQVIMDTLGRENPYMPF